MLPKPLPYCGVFYDRRPQHLGHLNTWFQLVALGTLRRYGLGEGSMSLVGGLGEFKDSCHC